MSTKTKTRKTVNPPPDVIPGMASGWTIDEWRGCYPSNWKGLIIPEAMAHPAKYSSLLIRRIYEHARDSGWVNKGDKVIDPFGGVALGGLDAMRLGLHWTGMELEPRFLDLGSGYDCPGFSKKDWVRFYGRARKVNFKHNFHWCPDCVKVMTDMDLPDQTDDGQFLFFSEPKKAAREIPSQTAHFFEGNIALWNRLFHDLPDLGSARLLQGDSRKLVEGVRNMDRRVQNEEYMAAISSPPYAETLLSYSKNGLKTEGKETYQRPYMDGQEDDYGTRDGQLGAMPNDGFDSAITSPPFLQSSGGANVPKGMDPALMDRHAAGNKGSHAYGTSDGQLSSMGDDGFDAAIGSPPFADSLSRDFIDSDHRRSVARANGISNAEHISPIDADRLTAPDEVYGTTPGQLGAMNGKDFSVAISSPPYESEVVRDRSSHLEKERMEAKGYKPKGSAGITGDLLAQETYGHQDGQLADESGTSFWLAARAIVDQVYLALKPGGHAVWVVKGYVKNKTYIDFPDQWRQLCEAAGFTTLHEHRALLVQNRGTSRTLEGRDVEHKTESKSFFRRLAEKKGSPRIDWETVYCMVKPRGNAEGGRRNDEFTAAISSPPYENIDITAQSNFQSKKNPRGKQARVHKQEGYT